MSKRNDGEASSAIEFPCDFDIKVMGKNSPDLTKLVIDIVHRHFPGFNDSQLQKRFSQFTNYISLTVTVHAESQQQLDELYRELTANPEILIVL
jgi:uncharacterized protein